MDVTHKAAAKDDVEYARHLSYVHWVDPASSRGQPVRLDQHNKVVFSVACLIKPRVMHYELVHPCCGVPMSKLMRFTMPDNIIRLNAMWNAALSSQAGHVGHRSCNEACVFCGGTNAGPDEAANPPTNAVRTCPLCLLANHPTCVNECLEVLSPVTPPAGLSLPAMFKQTDPTGHSILCAACQTLKFSKLSGFEIAKRTG